MKQRYNIGVLVGGVHTYFPQQIISGIRSAAQELSVNIYFFLGSHTGVFFQDMLGESLGNEYDYQFNTIYDYSLISGLDGLIINYGTFGKYLKEDNQNAFMGKYNSLPIEVLTEVIDLPNCHYLISDNYDGVTQMMEHLISEHGYQKILFVGGPQGNTDAVERKKAFADAMLRHGLFLDDTMIAHGDFSEFVDAQVQELLNCHPDAEAIFFANDEMAIAGYRVCKQRGLQIGKDIAIAAYDNCEQAQHMIPPLTTVFQDGVVLGRQAVYHLIDRLMGKQIATNRFPVKLICRESCGCTATEKADDTIESLLKSHNELTHELADSHQDLVNYQRRSWFLPFFSRILNEHVKNEMEFCRQIMVNLKRISDNNVYLFLHDVPVTYSADNDGKIPQSLYLAAYRRGDEIVSYYPYDRPEVSAEHGISKYLSDDTAGQYTFFLLYSNDRQYGLLACDIAQEDFQFFYMVSLQLGLSLQFLNISKKDMAYLMEMSQNMEVIREQNRVLDMISSYDELTGLLNLRGFMAQAQSHCGGCAHRSAYLIYADLDHLKEINDNWGHPEGNYSICAAGQILKDCLRDSDILARIGGDEFIAMAFSDAETFEESFRERVRVSCEKLNAASGKPFYVEITLGIISFDCHKDMDLEAIISQADEALYDHKGFRRTSVRKDTSC